MSYIVGFDIGGTKCAVTLAAENGTEIPIIKEKTVFITCQGQPYTVLSRLLGELDSILIKHSLNYRDISGIGVSCGGPLDSEKGTILSPPNLPGWDNIEICRYIKEKTDIECRLQNDANACAVAEWKYGAGKGLDNMIFLTFGTGLGAGLILNGKLYRGANDMAGEIGHVRLAQHGPTGYGKPGSCEGFCSGGGLRQAGIEAMNKYGKSSELYKKCGGNPENVSAKIIAELACDGDKISLEIYRKCAEKLGLTIAILCDILDPEAVIIGGIYMRSSNLIEKHLTKILNSEALVPCKVLKAGLGENIGDYAAISVAKGDY